MHVMCNITYICVCIYILLGCKQKEVGMDVIRGKNKGRRERKKGEGWLTYLI